MPTLVVVCDVFEPVTREPYPRTHATWPRKPKPTSSKPALPQPAIGGLKRSFSCSEMCATAGNQCFYYFIDSQEGWWNSGADLKPNLGGQIPPKRGYFPVPPTDTLQDVRSRIVLALEAVASRSRSTITR